MKQFLKASLFSVLAAAPFLSLNAQAADSPAMYVQQTPASTVRVLVYQDGKPAAGAKVKLYGNGGDLRHEFMTNSNGRVVINSLSAPGPLKLVAQTKQGTSATKEVNLYSSYDK